MSRDDTGNTFFSQKELNITAISPADTFAIVNDDISIHSIHSIHSSFSSPENLTATGINKANYNSTSGYGLINASAAVARAANQNTFADVPALGGNDWGADLIKAPAAWAQGYTGRGVVVAVLDTGVDTTHIDLQNNIWTNTGEIPGDGIDNDGNGYIDDTQGWNFADNTNNIIDGNGHGTHVAGTIAGENNGLGVTGIAYDAKIMPLKVLNDSGSGSYSSVANGIYYAVKNGANVINLSLGGNFPNAIIEAALKYASNQGVIVVMAAGNNSYPIPGYPASYAKNWGIAAGAVDKDNNIADFSNRAGINSPLYVTAPGVDIYSSVPGNQYATYSGTSMATPHVSGVVALMLSANQTLTHTQVREIIMETAGTSTGAVNSSSNSEGININLPLLQRMIEITWSDRDIIPFSHNNTLQVRSLDLIPSPDSQINPGIPSQPQPLLPEFRYADGAVGDTDIGDILKQLDNLRRILPILRRFLPII